MPGIQLFTGRIQSKCCSGPRSPFADGTDDQKLVMDLGGPRLASQCGRETVFGDGKTVLLSEADSFFLTHRPPGDLLVLRVPRSRLAALIREPEDQIPGWIPLDIPALRLLSSYVGIAWSVSAIGNDALQNALVVPMRNLIASAIGATRGAEETAAGRGLRAALLRALKRDIDEALDMPELSVGMLAERHACTPRFVQRLFEGEGTTFTEYVLNQRLARARRLLMDPRRKADKISAIALDSGFGDLSYFNRAFRRRYGETPSGVRGALAHS
jgi:AraC-like DNA-binding protein